MELNQQDKLESFLHNIKRYKFIAHRLGFLMGGYPENSFANLTSIFNNQSLLNLISGIELDIQFTADHIPVVIHDASTADISETARVIKETNLNELKDIKCGYRRSDYNSDIPWGENNNYNLHTLDSLLAFFMRYRSKVANRVIKIETKSSLLRKEDIIALRNLLRKYNELNENIIHISFFPWNLKKLRELESDKDQELTRTELLVDYSIQRPLNKFWNSAIDGISLGIKNENAQGNMEISKKAKHASDLNAFFCKRRNAVGEAWLRAIIYKYGYAGIYTINDLKNIEELMMRVSGEFLDENADKLMITSDNPEYLMRLKT